MSGTITRTASPRRSSAQTKEHVLAVAAELFYRDGIRATGVDTVAASAGVAPPTLYRLFATKDDLVAAYTERCSAAYQNRLGAITAPTAGTARQRLLAVFTIFTEDAVSDPCRGCPFLLVLAEYPDPASPAHARAVAHKTWVRELLQQLVRELADESPISDPGSLAEQLAVIADGVYGSAQALGRRGPVLHGPSCAAALIDFAASSSRR